MKPGAGSVLITAGDHLKGVIQYTDELTHHVGIGNIRPELMSLW
jgi:hypothetical protein